MATDKKTSVLVRSSLPEFLDTEGPKFQAFVRAYYEWLETNNQLTDRSKNLLEYTDIDRTQDEFIDWFRREILAGFPKTILADKKLLYQRILDLYRSKGSENAYKLLFRILYDEEIEFYYPGQDILKVSDGRWIKETSIRLAAPFVGNLEDIGGENIVGTVSGATAKVLRVTSTLETGINVFELFLSGTVGTFEDNEIVNNTANTLSGVVISSTGPLQGVVIQFGGARHTSGDRVSFTSASGTGASGVVIGTTGQSISPSIADGGSGYRVNDTVVSITGGDGSGASFEVSAISNPETIQTFDDTISDLSETRINANTFITSNTGTISANLSIANSGTVLSAALGTSNTTVGTISALNAITRGSNFTVAPSVSATDSEILDLRLADGSGGFKGNNAQLGAQLVAGSLTNVLIDTFGSGYNRSDLITISNTTNPAAENAIAAPLVSGIVTYPGKYTDTKGFVSWNNKIQDNYYYQEFSYSLRTTQTVDAYREIVKNVTHSAGTIMFGDHRISSNISLSLVADSYSAILIDNVGFQANTSFGAVSVGYSLGPAGAIASTAAFENDNQLIPTISPSSIASTADVSDDDHVFIMELGGASLISIPSALQIGTPSLESTITLTSIVFVGTSTLGESVVQTYSSNTVSQLQSNTFNDSVTVPQVGEPIVE
jgi:hypothetical protein